MAGEAPPGAGKDEQPAGAQPSPTAGPPPRVPEITIMSRVAADTLHVGTAPEVVVRAPDDEYTASRSRSTRRNLPDQLRPGATYRRWRIGYGLVSLIDSEAVLRRVEEEEAG